MTSRTYPRFDYEPMTVRGSTSDLDVNMGRVIVLYVGESN